MDYEIPLFVLKMVQIYFSERLVCRVYRRSGGGRMSFLAWRCTVFAKGSLQPKLHRTRLVLYTHDMPYIHTQTHTYVRVSNFIDPWKFSNVMSPKTIIEKFTWLSSLFKHVMISNKLCQIWTHNHIRYRYNNCKVTFFVVVQKKL